MIPRQFISMSELPLNQNGKVDRRALPAPMLIQHEADKSLPSCQTETILLKVFKELLQLDSLRLSDDVYLCGFNSLLASKFIYSWSTNFPNIPKISWMDLFASSTVHDIFLKMNVMSSSPLSDTVNCKPEAWQLDAETIFQISHAEQTESRSENISTVFLTGASGFVGIFLLNEILKNPSIIVKCLIRAESVDMV
jgi:hypothetical protein